MSDYGIRAATGDDIDDVLAFWAIAAEGTSITDDRDGVSRLLTRDPDALLIATVDDATTETGTAIVGTVIAGWDGWRCHLYRLAVAPAFRRRGIGRLLVDAAEQRFVEFGGRRGDAMVLDRNAEGRAAWAASGYRPEDHWTRWTKPLTG